MPEGTLFIVSGPSGSGKDTLLTELFARHPEVELSISSVTRDMRPGGEGGAEIPLHLAGGF